MITNSSLPSERHVYRIGLLERLPLRTPYPSIAARVIDIVRRLPRGQTTVIVDRTGAHAAYDRLVEKGLSPITPMGRRECRFLSARSSPS